MPIAPQLVEPLRGGDGALYIRPSVVRQGGKTYRYFRLVRSVRRNGKVVQETVAQLGELALRKRLGELFAIDYDLLLYDVTSTYFEGLGARSNGCAG